MSEPAMQSEASRHSWLILLIGTYPVPSGKDSEGKAVPPEEIARQTLASREKKSKGPVNSIKLCAPERCWLVCSKDASSRELAQYVQERSDYACRICHRVFEHPSDLEDCRMTFKGILAEIKADVGLENVDAKRFRVNVTFGTKQMSIGAMFAAVDAEITQFDLTEGERNQQNNGTVDSDTEELETFDPSVLLREHDIRQANRFFAHGDFYAAQKILKRYQNDEAIAGLYRLVKTCKFWQNLDYGQAADAALPHSSLWDHLEHCRQQTDERHFDLAILRDILDWSDYAFERGIYERAVDLLHKGLEYAAKLVLCEVTGKSPDGNGHFPVAICDTLGLNDALCKELNPDGKSTIALPMGNILFLFEHGNSERAKTFHAEYGNHDLKRLTAARNGNIHNLQPYKEKGAQEFRECLCDFLNQVLPALRGQPSILQLQHLPKPNTNHR